MTSFETVAGRTRWVAPALARTKHVAAFDEAGHRLKLLAYDILIRAPQVITQCVAASQGPVERQGYALSEGSSDRAWRFTSEEREIFCVLDEPSERAMLAWIVGAAPSRVLTSIERSIVAESVRRLVSPSADGSTTDMHEEPRARPSRSSWRCQLGFRGPGSTTATLQLFLEPFSDAQPPALVRRGPQLRDVTLHVRATLPVVGCLLTDIRSWRRNSMVRLQRSEREISLTLSTGNRRLAIAQLGTIFGQRAAKLIAISDPRR